jgi:chitinase
MKIAGSPKYQMVYTTTRLFYVHKSGERKMRVTARMELRKELVGGFRLFLASILTVFFILSADAFCYASSLSLQWDAESDPSVTGYKVYYQEDSSSQPFQGLAPIDVNNQTTATISGLDPAHAYYFAVTAYNASGVESSYSNIANIPEMTPPTVSLGSPASNTTVSGTVSVAASASDNVGVTKVEYYVNGVLQATDTSAPYVYSWNTSALASGSYTLLAKAYDAAGNVGQSSAVAVTVVNDTTPPTISLTTPADSAVVSGTVTIAANAGDNVAVSKVEFYENGVLLFAGNTTPYSFSWNTTSVANGSYTLVAKAYDTAGNIGQSSNVSVTVNNVVSDTTAPTVSAFTLPSTATSLTVAISSFTASDNVGVTGYLVTESASAPSAGDTGWSASAPATFTFSVAGSKTAYAWARDAVGNVSAAKSSSIAITLSDTTAPTVSVFTLPSAASSLTVAISSFTASDNIGVTGYMVTESASVPAAGITGWSASAPAMFTFSAAGSRTAYAWARDAAGNVSAAKNSSVAITLPDTTAPTVSAFTLPSATTSLTVAISLFTASDNIGVTGYLVTESASAPAASDAGWSASAPVAFTFSAAGSKTVYAWAKDAAGNVSAAKSSSVSITLPVAPTPLTISDALAALQIAVSRVQPTHDQITRLDVAPYINGTSQPDGKIDIGDVIVILGKVTGKIAL